jgi:hypothetical protein
MARAIDFASYDCVSGVSEGGRKHGYEHLDVVRSLDKDPQTYSSDDPFSQIVIDNFLPQSTVDTLVDEFPDPRNSIWNERIKDPDQVKAGVQQCRFRPAELNSATTLKP